MKQFSSFLTERKGEKAHREAEQMGLQYKGFGYWVDPKSGKVTHQTQGDSLVPVDPDVETDMYKGGGPEEQGMAGKAGGPGTLRDPKGQDLRGMMVGDAPEPGKERPGDSNNSSWEPGPDGDNCVTDQPPPDDIPTDSFVGKSNYHNWVAGPDGSDAINEDTKESKPAPDTIRRGKQDQFKRVAQRVRLGSAGRKLGGPVDGKETRDDAKWLQKKAVKGTGQMANMANELSMENPDPRLKLHQSVMDKLKGLPEPGPSGGVRNLKKAGALVKDQQDRDEKGRSKQKFKSKELVKKMNEELKSGGYFAQEDYDMDDVGDELGSGVFGSVYKGSDGDSVIKEGEIGPDELLAMKKMRDNPGFPTLLNAEFTSPFLQEDPERNNPKGESDVYKTNFRDKQAYFNPDEADPGDGSEGWSERFAMAKGRYAMSLAKGTTLDEWYEKHTSDKEPELYEKAMTGIMRLRRQMHEQGIAHQDMHGNNIFMDDEGNPSVIDLGLAQNNPMAAFMEALGGMSGHDGQFTMGAAPFMSTMDEYIPERITETMGSNLSDIKDQIMDKIGPDSIDPDDVEDIMKGGIRNTDVDLSEFQQALGFGHNDDIMSAIKQLYQGVGDESTAEKMAKAVGRLKDTSSQIFDIRNTRKLRRGEPLVPLKNFDD